MIPRGVTRATWPSRPYGWYSVDKPPGVEAIADSFSTPDFVVGNVIPSVAAKVESFSTAIADASGNVTIFDFLRDVDLASKSSTSCSTDSLSLSYNILAAAVASKSSASTTPSSTFDGITADAESYSFGISDLDTESFADSYSELECSIEVTFNAEVEAEAKSTTSAAVDVVSADFEIDVEAESYSFGFPGTEAGVESFADSYSELDCVVEIGGGKPEPIVDVITGFTGPWGMTAFDGELFVTNFDGTTVSVVDLNTNEIVRTINGLSRPKELVNIGTTLYVLSIDSARVDVSSNLTSITDGYGGLTAPRAIAASPSTVFIPDGNRVAKINSFTGVTSSIADHVAPEGMISYAGVNLVTDPGDDTVKLSDATTGTSVLLTVGGFSRPRHIVPDATPSGFPKFFYVSDYGRDTVSMMEVGAGWQVSNSIAGFNKPWYMRRVGDRIYVANDGNDTVSVIDLTSNTVIGEISGFNKPRQMVANGDYLYVANYGNNTVSVVDMTVEIDGGGGDLQFFVAARAASKGGFYEWSGTGPVVGPVNLSTNAPASSRSVSGITVSSGNQMSGSANAAVDSKSTSNVTATVSLGNTAASMSRSTVNVSVEFKLGPVLFEDFSAAPSAIAINATGTRVYIANPAAVAIYDSNFQLYAIAPSWEGPNVDIGDGTTGVSGRLHSATNKGFSTSQNARDEIFFAGGGYVSVVKDDDVVFNGRPTMLQKNVGLVEIAGIAVHPDGDWLYVVGHTGTVTRTPYLLCLRTDTLAEIRRQQLPAGDVLSVEVSPDGRYVYVLTTAGANSGTINWRSYQAGNITQLATTTVGLSATLDPTTAMRVTKGMGLPTAITPVDGKKIFLYDPAGKMIAFSTTTPGATEFPVPSPAGAQITNLPAVYHASLSMSLTKPLVFLATPTDTIYAINTSTNTVATNWTVGLNYQYNYPGVAKNRFVFAHPNGERMYVSLTERQASISIPIPEITATVSPDVGPPVVANQEQSHILTTAGGHSIPIPQWCDRIDAVVLGAGGGGGQGVSLVAGGGGAAGRWGTKTFLRGTDFNPGDVLEAVVGTGGAGATGTVLVGTAGSGTLSRVTVNSASIIGLGGAGAEPISNLLQPNGASPGRQTYQGYEYVGGVTATGWSAPGGVPGAGANGGRSGVFSNPGPDGGRGADGRVWIRMYGIGAVRPTLLDDSMQASVSAPHVGQWVEADTGFVLLPQDEEAEN